MYGCFAFTDSNEANKKLVRLLGTFPSAIYTKIGYKYLLGEVTNKRIMSMVKNVNGLQILNSVSFKDMNDVAKSMVNTLNDEDKKVIEDEFCLKSFIMPLISYIKPSKL